MKVKLIIISIILLLVMIFATGCIPVMEKLGLVSPTNEEQLSPEKDGTPDGLVKVLIGFKEKPGAAQQAMVKGAGGKIKYTYHIVDAIAASIPEKAIEALQKNPNIRYVEPDGQVYALDGELDNSWGVKHIGAGVVHDSLNKGLGVKIAIIDTGIDYTHTDLDANYIGGYDFVNDDDDPMDDNGHGTHVAGTVAAEDNESGVVGVAPEASLYALKVLNEKGIGDFSDVIAAIQWCVDNSIQVTNNSYGSSGDPGVSLKDAFDNTSGIIHVASAGNSGNPPARGDNVGYPARYTSVIAVAATDQSDKRARWSSTGPDVELSAPGVAINSTLLGGGYGEKSGTSMASPHVAGVAALVIKANPLSDVRTQLQDTADDLGDSSLYGYGLVDAAEAVGVEAPPTDTGAIAGNVTDAASTDLPIVGATVVVEGTSLFASTDGNGDYTIYDVPVGDYTITASAEGYENTYKEVTVEVDTTSTANFALSPVSANGTMYVDSITFSNKKAGPNYFLYITVRVVDGSSIPLEGVGVEMTLANGGGLWYFVGDTGPGGTVRFTLKKAPIGSYTATVTGLTLSSYGWNEGSVESVPYTLE